jgi:hypothetical protein
MYRLQCLEDELEDFTDYEDNVWDSSDSEFDEDFIHHEACEVFCHARSCIIV